MKIQRYGMASGCAGAVLRLKLKDGDYVLYTDYLAAMKEKDESAKWSLGHMQDLRNECFKILEALATDEFFSCGDNDLVEAPSRAIDQIAALQAEANKNMEELCEARDKAEKSRATIKQMGNCLRKRDARITNLKEALRQLAEQGSDTAVQALLEEQRAQEAMNDD
jgi:hypothetical protein